MHIKWKYLRSNLTRRWWVSSRAQGTANNSYYVCREIKYSREKRHKRLLAIHLPSNYDITNNKPLLTATIYFLGFCRRIRIRYIERAGDLFLGSFFYDRTCSFYVWLASFKCCSFIVRRRLTFCVPGFSKEIKINLRKVFDWNYVW